MERYPVLKAIQLVGGSKAVLEPRSPDCRTNSPNPMVDHKSGPQISYHWSIPEY